MKLITNQIQLIADSVERILHLIDSDPLSPTWGCAHPAYWRDKTSDVADMRRQEIMYTLALLFSHAYPGSVWKGDLRLLKAIESLLDFWCNNQYPDGSMDEWYKGERAFAAAAFSTHAVARTLLLVGNKISGDINRLSQKKLNHTANWLVSHDDLFKTNHQAVGVGALAFAARALNKESLNQNAKEKLQSIIMAQKKGGWFPEIGQMDVGYIFLTIEFVAMAMALWDDWTQIEPFKKAFDFACEWVHPDLVVGDEYGVCHNPYLSCIAVMIFSHHNGRASGLRRIIENNQVPDTGPSPLIADDLRLLRWGYQGLLAYEYAMAFPASEAVRTQKLPLFSDSNETRLMVFDDVGLANFSMPGCCGVFAGVAGGLVRLFDHGTGKNYTDYGYALRHGRSHATNITHNRYLNIERATGKLTIQCPILPVKKFMPSFLARVILRIACSTAFGSRWVRKFIDFIRKVKGTPINQSSFNLGSRKKAEMMLTRTVSFATDTLEINDSLSFGRSVDTDHLCLVVSANNGWKEQKPIRSQMKGVPRTIRTIHICKQYRQTTGWQLAGVLMSKAEE